MLKAAKLNHDSCRIFRVIFHEVRWKVHDDGFVHVKKALYTSRRLYDKHMFSRLNFGSTMNEALARPVKNEPEDAPEHPLRPLSTCQGVKLSHLEALLKRMRAQTTLPGLISMLENRQTLKRAYEARLEKRYKNALLHVVQATRVPTNNLLIATSLSTNMLTKTLSFLTALSLVAAVTAVPTIKTASRQTGFVFAASTIGPASATTTEETETADTTSAVPSAAPTPAAVETPTAAPPSVEDPMTSPDAGMPEYSFAYNVGGTAVGDFMADPEDWVVGETSTFEIPDAVIEGAPEEYADVYKSHRYGLVGSTWGYDIAVDNAGVYDCTLHYSEIFSEFFTEEPNRTFKVEISGDATDEVQEAEFDVMVELEGAEFTPYTRTFENIGIVNTLKIRETPSIGDAFLSGISCSYKGPVALPATDPASAV